jgi:hypothetical protein
MLFSVRNVAEALVNMDRPDEAIKLLGEAITFLQKTGTSDHIFSENRYKRSHFFRKQVPVPVPAVGRISCESRSSKSDF